MKVGIPRGVENGETGVQGERWCDGSRRDFDKARFYVNFKLIRVLLLSSVCAVFIFCALYIIAYSLYINKFSDPFIFKYSIKLAPIRNLTVMAAALVATRIATTALAVVKRRNNENWRKETSFLVKQEQRRWIGVLSGGWRRSAARRRERRRNEPRRDHVGLHGLADASATARCCSVHSSLEVRSKITRVKVGYI